MAKLTKGQLAVVRKHQKVLEEVTEEGHTAMAQTMSESRELLKRQLRGSLAKDSDGTLRWNGTHYKRIQAVQKHIADRVENNLRGALNVTTERAQQLSVKHLAKKFEAGGHDVAVKDYSAKVRKVMKPRIEGASRRIGSSRGATGIEAMLQKNIASGVLEEASVLESIKTAIPYPHRMFGWNKDYDEIFEQAAMNEEAAVDLITEGLFQKIESWIDRALSSENVKAYQTQANLAIKDVADENPDLELQKVWVNDMASNVCPFCDELDGEVVGADEDFDTEFGPSEGPPLHPWCACDVFPYSEAETAEEQTPDEDEEPAPEAPEEG